MAYTPTILGNIQTLEGLQEWVRQEFDRLARDLTETTVVELRPINAAPAKPREGMIVSADGTNWNPGSGAGAYEYVGAAWVKL